MNVNKIKILLIIWGFIPVLSFSQNEAAIWYFGSNAGLDFSGGTPVAITDGQITTSEGCSTISDQNGDLLFYTDGVHVWNKNHTYMENGTQLMGYWSATQSSLVVANPLNNGIFYIFTVDGMENYLANGFRYSVVDLNQNNGLGAVTDKNILLFSPSCEKITAVKHANGSDIWVVAHKWESNDFYSYLVTSAGIENPVISSVGLQHTGNIRNSIGYIKASVQGDRIALAIETASKIDILDFDNQTGILSNSINFDFPGAGRAYGVEFSPDGTKLYVSSWDLNMPMFQLDLQSGTPGGISGSAIAIAAYGSIQRAALQLGPDQKIYIARRFEQYVGVINNPNDAGTACNYVDEGVYLSGKQSLLGLPNYIQSYFTPFQFQNFTFNETCFGDTAFFNITNTNDLISVAWNFGDPASGTANTSSLWNPYHIYSSPGSYTVTLISQFSTNSDTVVKEIEIFASPEINLGNDTTFCTNEPYLLDPGQGYDEYLWQDGSVNSTLFADTSGLYWVQVTNEYGCTATDSIYLELLPAPEINLGNDTLLCIGTNLTLNAGSGFESYIWNTGSTDSTIIVITEGTYWVEVTNEFGCSAVDSINVGLYPNTAEDLDLGNDTTFCYGTQFILNAGYGYTFYEWQDGSNDSIFIADTAGIYYVHVLNPCGEGWDTIQLSLYPVTEISLGSDTSVCLSDGFVLLDPGMGFQSYLWQDGSQNQTYYANQSGDYWVEVIDSYGCPVYDSISLDFIDPAPELGADTAICNGEEITFSASEGFVSYLWNDGSNGTSISTGMEGIYWCEVTDTLGCVGMDSVLLSVIYPPDISLGNDTSICTGDSLTLFISPYDSNYIYYWFDGSSDSVKSINEEGYYWVQTSNSCGSDFDSVFVSLLPLPYIFIGNDTIIGIKDEITLDAGNGFTSYLWNTGSEYQSITVSDSGNYWVRVSDGTCYNYDTINIEIVNCDLFVPIVFTPNSDSYNDYFYAVASDDITDFDLAVYNRWGEQMWETTEITGKWDGKKNSKDCATGTYFWVVEYKCLLSNKTFTLRGSVTLLR